MKWQSGALCCLAALSVVVLAMLVFGAAQQEQPAEEGAWGKAAGGLSCSIRAGKGEYAPGEDVLLDVFLRNDTDVPLKVVRPMIHFGNCGDALPLEMRGPNGLCFYNGPYLNPPKPPGEAGFVTVECRGEIIGVSSVHTVPIRIVQKYWSMAPGDYSIRIKFVRKANDNEYFDRKQNKMVSIAAWEGEALSNAIAVRIKAQ